MCTVSAAVLDDTQSTQFLIFIHYWWIKNSRLLWCTWLLAYYFTSLHFRQHELQSAVSSLWISCLSMLNYSFVVEFWSIETDNNLIHRIIPLFYHWNIQRDDASALWSLPQALRVMDYWQIFVSLLICTLLHSIEGPNGILYSWSQLQINHYFFHKLWYFFSW